MKRMKRRTSQSFSVANSKGVVWAARALIHVVLAFCCFGATALIAAETSREYGIKAAYLYRFIGYVDWASINDSDSDQPFTIGILGDDVFGEALVALTRQTVDGRPVVLERIQSPSLPAISRCEMLFISSAAEKQFGDVLTLLGDANVLTVGETKGFAERGGMIEFRVRKNKIRFIINAQAAKRAGFQISARLLDLAEHVY